MIGITARCDTEEEARVMASLVHVLPPGVRYEVYQQGQRVLLAENEAPPG